MLVSKAAKGRSWYLKLGCRHQNPHRKIPQAERGDLEEAHNRSSRKGDQRATEGNIANRQQFQAATAALASFNVALNQTTLLMH